MPKLTIGMAHFDDYPGLWSTINGLRLYHAEALADCELLVIDNHPHSPHGKMAKDFINGWVNNNPCSARWIEYSDAIGAANAKGRVFAEATGDAVLCLDCHVMLPPGAIAKLIAYYDAHPDTRDLLSGPLVYDNLTSISTHFDDVWRGEMWGTWGTDNRGTDPNGEPFLIVGQGQGVFSCRRAAWLGFNAGFRGFGGEEMYIHEKYRQAGAQCICLPFLRWVHRFGRPDGVKYPLTRQHKVRNYLIGHKELGIPLDRAHEHFVGGKLTSQEEWDKLSAEADAILTDPSKAGGCQSCDEKKAKQLATLYDKAVTEPSDINEHCPKLRELASQCDRVTEFGMRHGVSTVAILAGQPKRFVTYDQNSDPIFERLHNVQGKTLFQFQAADILQIDIDETDMLFIDTRHTRDQLTAELARHAGKVSRWIVLHDTQIFGETGEDGGPGLLVGLREFMTAHPEWSVVYHTQANHGLTVISRNHRDKPVLPSTLQMAANFAKALAAHVMDGLDKVAPDTLVSRLGICTLCDQRTDNRCAVCGCFCEEKAGWASSVCPLGKWGPIALKAEAA